MKRVLIFLIFIATGILLYGIFTVDMSPVVMGSKLPTNPSETVGFPPIDISDNDNPFATPDPFITDTPPTPESMGPSGTLLGTVNLVPEDCETDTCPNLPLATEIILRAPIMGDADAAGIGFYGFAADDTALFDFETGITGTFRVDIPAGDYSYFVYNDSGEYCGDIDPISGVACPITITDGFTTPLDIKIPQAPLDLTDLTEELSTN